MILNFFENKTEFITISNKTILAVAIVFFSYDIILDLQSGENRAHTYLEALIFLFVALAFSYEVFNRKRAKKKLIESEKRLNRVTEELAEQVKSQLDRWKLTVSEKDVAWLVIKGFSFSEIATLRGVKEKTARQQASMIYSKAQVKGRAEFTATFLEDFLSYQTSNTT